MVFLGIEKITKKDTLIYYRNEYTGRAAFTLVADKNVSIRFTATVEIKPTGERGISIGLPDPIDYPILPIMKILKAEILKIETEGSVH